MTGKPALKNTCNATQIGQANDKGALNEIGTQLVDEFDRGDGGATGCNQVINQ